MQGTSSPHIVQTLNLCRFCEVPKMFPVKLNMLNDNDLFKDRGKNAKQWVGCVLCL